MSKPSDEQVGGSHYKDMPIQPSYFSQVNKLSWCCGNAVKYACRQKGDTEKRIEDLRKAIHYLCLELEWEHDVYLKIKDIEVPLTRSGWLEEFHAVE